MNKTLSLACRKIPYIPELRPLCGSVTGCLQLVQIEYWFSKNPHGFYKFLSPCEHEKYRDGDSWTEELGFSEHEFRAAFEINGVCYTRKDFIACLQEGNDPFRGKLYFRVYDSNTGLTYYFRNHAVIDAVLNEMVGSFSQELSVSSEDKSVSPWLDISDETLNTLSSEIKNFYVRILKILRSDLKKTELYNKEQKITTGDYNKKAAAKKDNEMQENPPCEGLKNISAAAFFDKAEDLEKLNNPEKPELAAFSERPDEKIATELTAEQKRHVLQVAKEYAQQYSKQLGNKSGEKLNIEICRDLLNPKSWTLCGNDFLRKLNVIKKHIREGRWSMVTPPVREITSGEPMILNGAFTTEILVLAEEYRALLQDAENSYYFLNGTVAEKDRDVRQKEEERMHKILQDISRVQQALSAHDVLEVVESGFPQSVKVFIPSRRCAADKQEMLLR